MFQTVLAPQAEEAARLHAEFRSLLRSVLSGKIDSSTFEDSCRSQLGTPSYVLFTLDKLVTKMVKHMQARGVAECIVVVSPR